jgi:hypothetical protein
MGQIDINYYFISKYGFSLKITKWYALCTYVYFLSEYMNEKWKYARIWEFSVIAKIVNKQLLVHKYVAAYKMSIVRPLLHSLLSITWFKCVKYYPSSMTNERK